GWVKVNSFTRPAEAVTGYARWTLARGGQAREARVLEWKRAGQQIAVRLDGVETREAAQALTGYEVQVDRSELPAAGPGEHYLHDMIGLEAVNREGAPLGQVDSFLDLPAHPVAVLRQGKVERLVPVVPGRLLDVDLAAGRVTFDWHPDD
ncbi:MAG: ribosome maturation factor RimM, partial [Steroidobacteraceae bacterium]